MPNDVNTAPIDVSQGQCCDRPPRGLRSRLLRLPGGWLVEARTDADAIVGELVTPPTYAETIAAGRRADTEIRRDWPEWKQALGEPLTPRQRLRESLQANSRAVAAWPPEVRAAINTRGVFNPPSPGRR